MKTSPGLSRRSVLTRLAAGAIGGGCLLAPHSVIRAREHPGDRPSAGHMLSSRADAAPATADDFTRMFAEKNDQTWSGGDQTTSFRAPNGEVYWISGDTILSDGEDPDGSYPETGTTMVSNRMLVQKAGALENAIAGGAIAVPNPATHTPENQERFWAQGAIVANGHLYLLCQRVIRDPTPGQIGFRFIGAELAKFRFIEDGKLAFVKMVPTPSTGVPGGTGPAHIQWAADAIEQDGNLYIYGYTHAQRGDPQLAAHYSYLARVPPVRIEDPAAWRFYRRSAGEWVSASSALSAAADNPDAILASQVSSVRAIAGRIVIAHKPWNGLGSTVYAEISSRPEGPFSRVRLFDSPAGIWEGSRYQTYGPQLHPEQRLSGADCGKTLVSINWNGDDFLRDVLANADLYKPRFHAVDIF